MNLNAATPAQRSQFVKWRNSVYISMFIGWSCHMLIRKNFPSTMSSLIQHQGFNHKDIGMISSCFAVAYGWSKFLGSIISDHASSQKVFSGGLILAGVCCLIFPLASTVTLACIVWFVEGVVQGCGWPPCVILLKAWYPPTHIGRWWSLLASAGNIMSAIVPLLVIFIITYSHWSMSYYAFGIGAIAVGITVKFTILDSPNDIGLESFHKLSPSNDAGVSSKENAVGGNWYKVFFIRDLWIVSLMYVILYFSSYSTMNWSQLYLVEKVHLSETRAAACYSIFQVGATAGNFTSGFLSDLFVTPKTAKCPSPRAPFLLAVSVLLVFVLHLFTMTVEEGCSEMWISFLLCLLGFLISSGVAVVGLTSMEVVPGHLVSSAHGLACAVAQIGAFTAGWPFTLMLEKWGWNRAYGVVELSQIILVVASLYLLYLLLGAKRKLKLS